MTDPDDLHARFADHRARVLGELRHALRMAHWRMVAAGLDDDSIVPLVTALLVDLEEAERAGTRRAH